MNLILGIFISKFILPLLAVSTALFVIVFLFRYVFNKEQNLQIKYLEDSDVLNATINFKDQDPDLKDFFTKNSNFRIVSTEIFNIDKYKLNKLSYLLMKLLDESSYNPKLPNAIFEWLVKNMTQDSTQIKDFLIVLFNKIAEFKSGYYNYFIGSFLYRVSESKISNSDKVFKVVFEDGNSELKHCIIDFVLNDIKYNLSKETFNSIINFAASEDQGDDEYVRRLADTYAGFYNEDSKSLIDFFNSVFPTTNITPKHLNFLFKFIVKLAIINASNLENLASIGEFIKKKYYYHIKILLNDKIKPNINGNKFEKAKHKFYNSLTVIGFNQWDLGIGTPHTEREINNKFWILAKGEKYELCQRDILYDFYKYIVALYNENYEELDIDRNIEFRSALMRMVNFNKYSVVGYVAVLELGILLTKAHKDRESRVESIFSELIANDSDASRCFMAILLDTLAKANKKDKEFCLSLLLITKDKIIPHLIKYSNASNIFIFADSPALDIEQYWHVYEPIFQTIIAGLRDNKFANEICDRLVYVCLLPNKNIGKKIANYFVEIKLYEDPLWRNHIFKMLAAIYLDDKKFISDLCSKNEKLNDWEVLKYLDRDIYRLRDIRSYQTNWNELFIYSFAENKKLGYYVEKDLIAGLAQSNTGEEFAEEFRRFVINSARGFLNFEEQRNMIDIVSALNDTECKRIINGGSEYTPHTLK